jgi:Dictyostelium (slime mold) repeat
MMTRRLVELALASVGLGALLAACSVVNAPEDPVEPGTGGSTTTTGGSGGTGGTGGGGAPPDCTTDAECEDGDDCTINSCGADGECEEQVVDPDDGDVCTDDSCDEDGNPVNVPAEVDDGDMCTVDWCEPDVGLMNVADRVVFEHQLDDATGWNIEAPWAMGPAAPSGVSNTFRYRRDPAEDHTPSMNEGLAGVVIGGFAPTAVMPVPSYLETPEFDATIVGGELILSYWRILISDYDPFMINTVEVWDGTAWQEVFSSGSSPGYDDTDWVQANHNITAYANPTMKVRFGFFVSQNGAFTDVGGWSVDDVRVYNAAVDVVDGDLCTQDLCDPAMGAVNPPIDLDDLNACTADTCDPLRGPKHDDESILFMADFSSPNHGFNTGQEWGVGPATAGGNADPAQDTSLTDDNRVAGVNIGGNYQTPLQHGFYYLQSQSFAVPAGTTQVELQFQRWLTSDYTPFVDNIIQVNGISIWNSGPSPGVFDSAWQTITHDLTPFISSSMNVRFGFNLANAGVIARGGWNVDDIIIRDPTCGPP